MNKYMHFSFDNVIENFIDINKNSDNYKSVFDNLFFGDLKYIHDKYGAVFTINCVIKGDGYNISEITDKYRKDFLQSSDWLKFAFHSKDIYSKYSEDVLDIKEQYKTFTDSIIKIAGENSIDTVIRLGYYTGTLNNIKALKCCDYGIEGFLTADDGRQINYYLNDAQIKELSANNFWYDKENDLYAIPTQTRLEKVENIDFDFKKISDKINNRTVIVEIFTHEHCYDKEKLLKYVKWAYENKYIFDFAKNHFNEL